MVSPPGAYEPKAAGWPPRNVASAAELGQWVGQSRLTSSGFVIYNAFRNKRGETGGREKRGVKKVLRAEFNFDVGVWGSPTPSSGRIPMACGTFLSFCSVTFFRPART